MRLEAVALRVMLLGVSAWSGACSGSSSGSTTANDDAGERHDAHAESASCASTPTCTGSLSGGVTADLATCTVSGIQGVKGQFAEVNFNFTAVGGGSVGAISGGGNVSTTGSFAAGAYVSDGGLWNDMATSADSLWTVTWGTEMAECVGVHVPDEIDSLCADASLDLTSLDSCNGIHGTFDTTLPAYMGTPAVAIHLRF